MKELLARRPAPPGSADAPAAVSDAAAPAAPRPARLVNEQYFEELDQAFATLSTPKLPVRGRPFDEAPTDAIDWFSRPAPAPPDVVPPPPVQAAQPPAAPAPVPPPQAQADVPAAPVALPALPDAFAALLAAEQTSPAASAAPVWPAATLPATTGSDVVEEVTRRVLEQMSDKTVREMVAGIVAQVAERLVREEIERIKNTIS